MLQAVSHPHTCVAGCLSDIKSGVELAVGRICNLTCDLWLVRKTLIGHRFCFTHLVCFCLHQTPLMSLLLCAVALQAPSGSPPDVCGQWEKCVAVGIDERLMGSMHLTDP